MDNFSLGVALSLLYGSTQVDTLPNKSDWNRSMLAIKVILDEKE
jgi:hypothetical protein